MDSLISLIVTCPILQAGTEMDLLFNELSLHEQFPDVDTFRQALGQLMAMRAAAKRSGREVSCKNNLLGTHPIHGVTMRDAITFRANREELRATLAWLNKRGPFWDASHSLRSNEWLECKGNLVTDSGVGEAAYRKLRGIDCGLISMRPSNWTCSPVVVEWKR